MTLRSRSSSYAGRSGGLGDKNDALQSAYDRPASPETMLPITDSPTGPVLLDAAMELLQECSPGPECRMDSTRYGNEILSPARSEDLDSSSASRRLVLDDVISMGHDSIVHLSLIHI